MNFARKLVYGMALFLIAGCLVPDDGHAQYWRRREYYPEPQRDIFPGDTFTFCRIHYQSEGGRGRRGGWGGGWETDYPESDLNFPTRLGELTTIRINRDEQGNIKHAIVGLMEDDLFHYPFVYMLEVGRLVFDDDEAARLR